MRIAEAVMRSALQARARHTHVRLTFDKLCTKSGQANPVNEDVVEAVRCSGVSVLIWGSPDEWCSRLCRLGKHR